MTAYAVVDPASGKIVREYPTIGDGDLEAALARADDARRAALRIRRRRLCRSAA